MESPFKETILRGKVALLTGGASGIGFEISTQFGKHGASIAIMGRRQHVLDAAVDSLRSQGVPAIGLVGDVRKREDAVRVLESTVKHYGKLDILVNAAAGNFLVASEDLSPNGFRTVMDIDSVGTFTMCHGALKYLKKGEQGKGPARGGTILNISATLHYTAAWYQIHVSAAKAAVDSITRSLALEWGTDYDIRVNGIAPGPIEGTPGMAKLAPEEMNIQARDSYPLYKLGEKWDIAMAALYLASDAGKYVNGTTLIVDGGLWLSRPRHIAKEAVKEQSRAVELRKMDLWTQCQTSKGSSSSKSHSQPSQPSWPQAQGKASKSKTKSNIKWSDSMDAFLLKVMKDCVMRGQRVKGAWTTEAMTEIVARMNRKFSLQLNKEHIRNRLKTVIKNYRTMKNVLCQSGFVLNPTTMKIEVDDEVWKRYVEDHPNSKDYRKISFDGFYDLDFIFGEPTATGGLVIVAKEEANAVDSDIWPEHVPADSEVDLDDDGFGYAEDLGSDSEPQNIDVSVSPPINHRATPENVSLQETSKVTNSRKMAETVEGVLKQLADGFNRFVDTQKREQEVAKENTRMSRCIELMKTMGVDDMSMLEAMELFQNDKEADTFIACPEHLRNAWLERKIHR